MHRGEMASQEKDDNESTNSNFNNEPKAEKKPRELKDLEADVLKKIFKHLLVSDLVNIVEYDPELRIAALSAFKERMDKDDITITNKFNPHEESSSSSVRLLNHFGNEVTKLVVYYHEDYREISKVVNDAIISQCYRTLQEVEFRDAGRFNMFGISQIFENVHTVSFLRGSLCEIVSQFGKWFPKAHTLKLNWQNFGDYSNCLNVEKNVSLKHLEIGKLDNSDSSTTFLKRLIELSPELETLRIEIGCERIIHLVDTCINANMPNLKSLHLNLAKITFVYNRGDEKPHFKNLKNLTIELVSGLNGLSISTDNLHTLKLCASDGFGKDCGEFLINNKNVEVVELDGPYIKQPNDVISSFSKLPNLKEIKFPFPYFHGTNVQLDQVNRLLTDCKRLYKLTITAKNIFRKKIPVVESLMNAFAASVDVQWKSSISKEVIPVYEDFCRINYELSLEKKQSDRACRMEQRMKRKATTSIENRNTCKKIKSIKKHLQLKNLNDDCLIVIFKYLSIDDLVHIVQYNNHFITAALIAFKHKYCNDQIKISVEYNSMVRAPLWCVELLKYFGSEITKLQVKYYNEDARELDDAINNAIIKYCRQSLVELEFINSKNSTMNGIRKSFENIRSVSFLRGCLSEIVYDFGKWFPKANSLKIKHMEELTKLNKRNVKTAPALQHLEVQPYTDYRDTICGQFIANNPQLKSLYHHYGSYTFDARKIFSHFPMPNLEILHLIFLLEADTVYEENGIYRFEMLKHLHIEFKNSSILRNLLIFSNNLETLSLNGSSKVKASDCVSLIRLNPSVKSIKIVGCMMNVFDWNVYALCELLPTLPNLNEVELPYDRRFRFIHSTFRIDSLLGPCKSLLKLVINCNCEQNSKEIEDQYNDANDAVKSVWTISKDIIIDDNNRYLNRYILTFNKNV